MIDAEDVAGEKRFVNNDNKPLAETRLTSLGSSSTATPRDSLGIS